MASAAQRQRQKAAKVARRKEIVTAKKKAEAAPRGLAEKTQMAARGQLVRCVAPERLFEAGIGMVVAARTLPTGLLGCAFFLLDVFCLGVKDVFYREMTRDDLDYAIEGQSQVGQLVDADPSLARKLIRDAVAYAAEIGLAPAKDYRAIERIFGDIDADACGETFTFGKDGKPFYAPGPSDSPARIRTVAETLNKRLGAEGWHYLLGLPSGSDSFEDDDDELSGKVLDGVTYRQE